MEGQETNKIQIQFAAIDPYIKENIARPTEVDSKKGFMTWGDDNRYPDYLNSLYDNVATLHSIIEGTVDFICGNAISIDDLVFGEKVNTKDETIEDLVRMLARDYLMYGGFAVNVVRNKMGKVAGLYYIDLKFLRADEHRNKFFYSKDWNKSFGRVKTLEYPKFDPNKNDPTSIFYYSNSRSDVYPSPLYSASIQACEMERNVNEYHLNSLYNGFSASYMVNFNNGIPNDEQKEEIEQYFNEKYTGYGNAARMLFSFSPDKEHAAEMIKLDTEDFGEKYKSLIERAQGQIFTAFRALPQLFGINLNTGFNVQEYEEAFRLYNRTTVRPIQNILAQAINKITGYTISITPFTLDEEDAENKIIEE